MRKPTISIICSTYGRFEGIQQLVASVRASTPEDAYEFVVVSSDSPTSEKVQWLRQQRDIVLILADERKKWQLRKQSAHYYINLGIKKSQNEWIVVANDDMYFDKDWYKELVKVISDPKNSNVGLIIVSSHIGKVKYGSRIIKIGKTKKSYGPWKDLYLSDVCVTKRDVLKKIGWYDERLDWYGAGADNSLAIEFLTDRDTIPAENIRIDHVIAQENRHENVNAGDGFVEFNYIKNKWDVWCREHNCQYIWDPGVKPFTLKNRVKNYLFTKAKILRHYIRYLVGNYQ